MKYPKFDPDRPYGETSPIENGCVYWQNGHHYDINYNCVDFRNGKVLQRHQEEPAEASTDAAVDLVAWAKGDQDVTWFSVRKALQEQGYDPMPTTAAEARAAILAKAE